MQSKGNIMIVEDSEALLELISSMLEAERFTTFKLKSGELALDFLKENHPDLILLDRTLPGISGFEVCKSIQRNDVLSEIPVIFLTATSEIAEKVEGFKLGAVDYITKPFQKEELLARVSAHIKLYKLNRLLKEQTKQLKEREAVLNDLIATKDKFFSIIAHDLKGPFNNIMGLTLYLKENLECKNFETIKDYINHLYELSNSSHNLLVNLLEWASIQRNTIIFNQEKVNLHSVVLECVGLLKTNVSNKNISLVVSIPNDSIVYADRNMLKTVIRNLLSNAIKFTPAKGRIEISEKRKFDFVEICVCDSGVGIDYETLAKIFDINEQQSTFGTEGEPGTGLGLPLCKEFVEKHGGEIWVESELAKGSKFGFTIPLRE